MRNKIIFLLAILVVGVAGGCSQPPLAPSVPVADIEAYRLDSGDLLRVVVFGQEGMSGEYLVDGAGNISMPLLAQVAARGRTVEQLEQEIGQRLQAESLLVNPSVNVQVITFRPFFILGEVAQPGQFGYVEGMTVLTAVAMAGGFTYRADTVTFTITRKVGAKIVEAHAGRTTPVKPGDVIYVHERIL